MPIISSAIIGALLGEVTKIGSGLISEWTAGREHKRKIEMMAEAHKQGIELKEVEAFTKAQMDLSGGMSVPNSAPTWMQAVCVVVNAIIHSIRPFLTTVALGMIIYMLMSTVGVKRDELLDESIITCTAVLRWWFGYRDDMKRKTTKS